MATEGDNPGPVVFDPFSPAEAACEEILDSILTEGGRLLFDSYIEKKSFPYSSNVVSQLLISELKMCFVRYDAGEMQVSPDGCRSEPLVPSAKGPLNNDTGNSWALEPEPARCRIDTWARACVPIRRKLMRPKMTAAHDSKRLQRGTKVSSSSNASNGGRSSRAGFGNSMEHFEARATATKPQMIQLAEEHEEDEEESGLRDMKEREARRKREEETRTQRKAAEDAEEAARLAHVKDQMKNKPFTYDSNGSIIWVQPMKMSKLPNTNPVPTFNLKKDAGLQSNDGGATARPPPTRGPSSERSRRRPQPKRREGEFVDSFQKFTAQQPSMIEAMTMAPGVELAENGFTKSGAKKTPRQAMTRTEYENMVLGGLGYSGVQVGGAKGSGAAAASRSPSARPAAERPASEEPTPRGLNEEGIDAPAATEGSGIKVVRKPDLEFKQVPHPPDSPRPVQPAAPPTFRRAQMKRDALGYTMSTRERVPTGTASRFPKCAPQPPLGATMGHGLVPAGQKQEEYYFPSAISQNAASSIEVDAEASDAPGAGLAAGQSSVRGRHGQIVSRNPELVRRLFAQ